MRTVAVVGLLVVVLTATALDLSLGVLWVLAILGVLLLRRRIRLGAWLVLLVADTLLVWGGSAGSRRRRPRRTKEAGFQPGAARAPMCLSRRVRRIRRSPPRERILPVLRGRSSGLQARSSSSGRER